PGSRTGSAHPRARPPAFPHGHAVAVPSPAQNSTDDSGTTPTNTSGFPFVSPATRSFASLWEATNARSDEIHTRPEPKLPGPPLSPRLISCVTLFTRSRTNTSG